MNQSTTNQDFTQTHAQTRTDTQTHTDTETHADTYTFTEKKKHPRQRPSHGPSTHYAAQASTGPTGPEGASNISTRGRWALVAPRRTSRCSGGRECSQKGCRPHHCLLRRRTEKKPAAAAADRVQDTGTIRHR